MEELAESTGAGQKGEAPHLSGWAVQVGGRASKQTDSLINQNSQKEGWGGRERGKETNWTRMKRRVLAGIG